MDKDVEFWEHWCPVEQDIIGTEKGHTCNWCDATENDEQLFPLKREVLRNMNEEDLKNFKRFDKIYWKLNLVDTVLLIIVVAVVLVSLYV